MNKVLQKLGLTTERIAGDNRFETAEIIAAELEELVIPNSAVLVDGFEFADAMSIAPFAAREGMPIFLTRTDRLNNEYTINNYEHTYIVGGENGVSTEVQSKINSVTRIAAKNRYETNINVLNEFGIRGNNLYVATGTDYADALTGSLLAAKNDSAVALIRNNPSDELNVFISQNDFIYHTILGGEAAVSATISQQLSTIYQSNNPNIIYENSGYFNRVLVDNDNGLRISAYSEAGVETVIERVHFMSPHGRIIRVGIKVEG